MKKLLLVLLLSAWHLTLFAQRTQVNLAAECTVPVFQNDRGLGLFVKGLYRVGSVSQVTLTTGVSILKYRDIPENSVTTTRLVPVLVGYKFNYGKLYLEPQAGYGELGGRISKDGFYSRPSVGAFFWAVGAGFNNRKLMAGIRFQQAHGVSSPDAGTWHDRDFHHTALHIGYRIF